MAHDPLDLTGIEDELHEDERLVRDSVSRFVDDLPADYPPRLRALILQSSDLLMRAALVQAPADEPGD